jgi:acyl-CoA thioester hydrolase
MTSNPRRQKHGFFTVPPDAPPPVVVRVQRRISFSDVDPMGVLWHGRYAYLFEAASEALGRRCGMTYADFFAANLRAPIVQFHVDYFASLVLAETATVTGRMIWSPAARMDIEYEVHRENGVLAATGYTVQMFVDERGNPLLAPPPLQERCRQRWLAGEFASESGGLGGET